jgi:DNA-binding sugar fermentation-stimulating protein
MSVRLFTPFISEATKINSMNFKLQSFTLSKICGGEKISFHITLKQKQLIYIEVKSCITEVTKNDYHKKKA